jgi:hypothetical protein
MMRINFSFIKNFFRDICKCNSLNERKSEEVRQNLIKQNVSEKWLSDQYIELEKVNVLKRQEEIKQKLIKKNISEQYIRLEKEKILKQEEELQKERLEHEEELQKERLEQEEELQKERLEQEEELQKERLEQGEELQKERLEQEEELQKERLEQEEELKKVIINNVFIRYKVEYKVFFSSHESPIHSNFNEEVFYILCKKFVFNDEDELVKELNKYNEIQKKNKEAYLHMSIKRRLKCDLVNFYLCI